MAGSVFARLQAYSLAFAMSGLALFEVLSPGAFTGFRGVIAAGLLATMTGFSLLKHGARLNGESLATAGMLLVLVCLLSIQVAASSATEYGTWKLSGFLVFAAFPAVIVLAHAGHLPGFHVHLFAALTFLAVMSALTLAIVIDWSLVPTQSVPYQLRMLGVDVIALSRQIGLGGMAAAALWLLRITRYRPLLLVLCAACVAAQLAIGERGPILAFFAGVGIVLLGTARGRRGRRTAFVLGAIAVAGLVTAVALMPRFSFEELTNDPRVAILRHGFETFATAPWLGIGLGEFAHEFADGNARSYVHNIFAEVAIEAGLSGLIVFVAFLAMCGRGVRRTIAGGSPRAAVTTLGAAGWVFALSSAQVSGDLVTNGYVCILGAVAATATRCAAQVPVTRPAVVLRPSVARPSRPLTGVA